MQSIAEQVTLAGRHKALISNIQSSGLIEIGADLSHSTVPRAFHMLLRARAHLISLTRHSAVHTRAHPFLAGCAKTLTNIWRFPLVSRSVLPRTSGVVPAAATAAKRNIKADVPFPAVTDLAMPPASSSRIAGKTYGQGILAVFSFCFLGPSLLIFYFVGFSFAFLMLLLSMLSFLSPIIL